MVNYLNSKPFEFGLINSTFTENLELKTATPAACAQNFMNGNAEIALLPVGALEDLKDYKIISDYCIGCDGEVRTVCIFSNEKIEDCTRLLLDNHSRTSFLLSQILIREYFRLDLPFSPLSIDQYIYQKGDAVLMIGDKVFEYENNFKYKYDLGVLWKEWTGLPFVFAVWVAKNDLDLAIEHKLNDAFKLGVEHLPEIIQAESSENLDLYYYYTHNIQYNLDEKKKKGLAHFLHLAAQILPSRSY
ncbi:MAG: menaquinone biosynthesis protein [Saprospiraceae bacterium]|nr:menaquinone biosynthesis protein [Saprospiraceae bacterium]